MARRKAGDVQTRAGKWAGGRGVGWGRLVRGKAQLDIQNISALGPVWVRPRAVRL